LRRSLQAGFKSNTLICQGKAGERVASDDGEFRTGIDRHVAAALLAAAWGRGYKA